MTEKIYHIIKQKWVLLLCLLFALINGLLIVCNCYYLLFLPFLLLILFLAVFSLDKLLLLTVFFVPLSFPLQKIYTTLPFNLQLPTEVMLIIIMVICILKFISESNTDRRIFYHPISIAIYLYLGWMFLTSITSTMPLVSFKFLISRIWFITAFYFLAVRFFSSKKQIRQYVWAYAVPFIFVVSWAIWSLWQKGLLSQQYAQTSARPFFTDHTSYGAMIAMILPFIAGFGFYRKYPISLRIISQFLVVFLLFALVLSYTRAAWVSVGVAIFVLLAMVLRIKFAYISILAILLLGTIYQNRTEIVLKLEQNNQDSSKDLEKHVKSIYNIHSDMSNLERINRWKCAIKMFKEKPIFGWGPGTYMFQYAPFQVSHDRTLVSTNRGDWGNAHSEFIGPLAESGLLGTLFFIILLITVFYTAIKRYSTLTGFYNTRLLILCATLGLVTYAAHGILNNYLDSDKASALFWGYIAIIVAIDIAHSKREPLTVQN